MKIKFTDEQSNYLRKITHRMALLLHQDNAAERSLRRQSMKLMNKFGPGTHTIWLKDKERFLLMNLAQTRLNSLTQKNSISEEIGFIQSLIEALEKTE